MKKTNLNLLITLIALTTSVFAQASETLTCNSSRDEISVTITRSLPLFSNRYKFEAEVNMQVSGNRVITHKLGKVVQIGIPDTNSEINYHMSDIFDLTISADAERTALVNVPSLSIYNDSSFKCFGSF